MVAVGTAAVVIRDLAATVDGDLEGILTMLALEISAL